MSLGGIPPWLNTKPNRLEHLKAKNRGRNTCPSLENALRFTNIPERKLKTSNLTNPKLSRPRIRGRDSSKGKENYRCCDYDLQDA